MTIRQHIFQQGLHSAVRRIVRELLICIALPSVVLVSAKVIAQQMPAPSSQQRSDEQIANDINSKLMSSSTLRPLGLGVWVHGGTATLSGTVPTQATRQEAEGLVQSVPGVKAVDDKLVVGSAPANGSGTQAGPPPPGPPPPPPTAQEQENYEGPPANYPQGEEGQGPPPPYNPPSAEYQEPANQPMVTVPAGTPLYVMMLQTIDSKHTKLGSPFRAVVAQDVMLPNGAVAVPRGAYMNGTVVDARPPGHLKGRPKLALQLTHLDVGGAGYPMMTGMWVAAGPGKGGQTAATVTGSAAFGAVAGGIVGGGPTALLGAALGGLGGVGLSALSPGARLLVPAESVITFRLAAPLTVREPTPGEMRALGANLPPPPYGYGGQPPPYGYPGYRPPPPPGAPIPGAPPDGYPY